MQRTVSLHHFYLLLRSTIFWVLPVFVLLLFVSLLKQSRKQYTEISSERSCLISLRQISRSFFVISSPVKDNSDQRRESMSIHSGSQPEFIVSCGYNSHVYGKQSMNTPLGLSSFQYVFDHSSLPVDYYPLPEARERSLKKTKNEGYYTITRKVSDTVSARFIFLDTHSLLVDSTDRIKAEKQLQWLANILQHAREDWILVAGHDPVFSEIAVPGCRNDFKIRIRSLLERYHVDFYLTGCGQGFEHASLKRSTLECFSSGSDSGNGSLVKNENVLFSSSLPGFVLMTISDFWMETFYITTDGKVIYSTKRMKRRG
ncbi:MAG TPA: hypothetical protein VIH57_08365 [Bacteroidales bacterium]